MTCGRTKDLMHVMVGCGDESDNLKTRQQAFAIHERQGREFVQFFDQDMERRWRVQEHRNWRPVKRGTLRLRRGRPTDTDGAAKTVGTPWEAGGSAVVQYDELGREQAWAISLPECFPISAVAAEHMKVLLCVVMAHKAQIAEQKEMAEQEWLNKTDEWAKSLTAHADCIAVI